MTIHGECDPAFKTVREVFEENFARGAEDGAAITVYVRDRLVVDLWGGVASTETGEPWRHDTLCQSFSATKAITATAALVLAERGCYELDGPVTDWWPEFGVRGKEQTTAAHLLSHSAGLPTFDRRVTVEEACDHAAMAAELAGQAPAWPPGTAHGYHAATFGWLAGEIIWRHAGQRVGDFVRAEFGRDLDMWIGAPPEILARTALMTLDTTDRTTDPAAVPKPKKFDLKGLRLLLKIKRALKDERSLMWKALNNFPIDGESLNNHTMLTAGWPSVGMISTAPALASFYRDLVAGRIIGPELLREATTMRVRGPDAVLVVDSAFGLGFQAANAAFSKPLPAIAGAFGHAGAGGTLGQGDLESGVAMAYYTNLMGHHFAGDTRAYRLVEAVYDSL